MPTEERNDKDARDRSRVFRYWIEVREVSNGSTRTLPLSAATRIHIPRRKSEEQRPREEILQLKDGEVTLEAKDLDDLSSQLRERYPDGAYERTLHLERDHEGEERRNDALNGLIQIIIESFVKSFPAEDAAALAAWSKTKEGRKSLREFWPKIVDVYFHALCNPKR
jgi:hypothetical protein